MTLLTLEWAWKANTGFRQCKHILVSLDELDVAVPQRDYVDQVETFVKHLFKAFDAEHTFPALIWLFTPSTNRSLAQRTATIPFAGRQTIHAMMH